jgi:hypothetical protein
MDIKEFMQQDPSDRDPYGPLLEQAMRYYGIVKEIPRSMYYAHCQSIYNTQQEERDINAIRMLGWMPVNPNAHAYNMHVKRMKEAGLTSEHVMGFFTAIVRSCKALAFRSLPDRNLPAGVGREIAVAEAEGIVVVELPSMYDRKIMGVNETRRYLEECGQR